jgi:type II secretory pathway pseudopilin PulG
MSFRRSGFTLLEICLALVIIVTVILLIVPSVSGLFAEQRLKRSYERLDQLVAATTIRSMSEKRSYALVWENHGIRSVPLEGKPGSDESSQGLHWSDDEKFELQLPTALGSRSKAQWVFWSNGTCEPAIIAFQGSAGSWAVRYDPLTVHGQFLHSSVP